MSSRSIVEEYAESNPRSRALYERQRARVPGGATHAARAFAPFPLFVRRSAGARKWDVDGHEYVDYWMGHGAQLLGHSSPPVVEAVSRQLGHGFHGGGETELGLEWAELVCKLVPSAERVRFTASGGEATQLAIRVARALTARTKLLKLQYGFHGWHDAATVGFVAPFDVPWSAGVPPAVAAGTLAVPPNDLPAVEHVLAGDADVAAVIVEPGGVHSDAVPVDPAFLEGLRRVTREHGVVLIFDEVVTGFRYAPGGAQEYFGVLPDLTTLGKVLGGGIPCGALAGGAQAMAPLEPSDDPEARFIPHPGTWNANPVAAAAGVATLREIEGGGAIATANVRAEQLRRGMNDVLDAEGVAGAAYGRASIFKVFLGEPPGILRGDHSNAAEDAAALAEPPAELQAAFRRAMLLEGVDLFRSNGFMSSAHTEDDVELTLTAATAALRRMKRERPRLLATAA